MTRSDKSPGSYKRTAFHEHIYWRKHFGVWHCFQKAPRSAGHGPRAFESLCLRAVIIGSGGQSLSRPLSEVRCGICDGEEMKLLGAEESMPATTKEL